METVNPAIPLGAIHHQPGILQQTQMPGDRGPADGEIVGYLLHRTSAVGKKLDDGSAVRITERREWIGGMCGCRAQLGLSAWFQRRCYCNQKVTE